ncbi:MAG: UDP-glucose 4-epimerase GalE [Nitriliruptoraceae bacterium]
MRVLVTGGAGFIGSATAAALRDAGHDVVVADDLSRGRRDMVPAGVPLEVVDVTDAAALEPVLARGRFDACLHFAALIEVGDSMERPEAYFRTNTAGTAVLLEALLRHGVERFVFSSTAATYGEPERTPIDEEHPQRPTNPYGESKLSTERMLAWLHARRGLRSASLRYFNAAGAVGRHGERADAHQTHLVPVALMAVTGERPALKVFGTDWPTPDGTCIRDYIHVADLADAHVRALDVVDREGLVRVNLGNGRGSSVREVLDAVVRITGRPVPHTDEPRRSGDPAVLIASADRARELLGWRPTRDLDAIVGDAWAHLTAGSAPA